MLLILLPAVSGAPWGGQLLFIFLHILFEDTNDLRRIADVLRDIPYDVISAVLSGHADGFGPSLGADIGVSWLAH